MISSNHDKSLRKFSCSLRPLRNCPGTISSALAASTNPQKILLAAFVRKKLSWENPIGACGAHKFMRNFACGLRPLKTVLAGFARKICPAGAFLLYPPIFLPWKIQLNP